MAKPNRPALGMRPKLGERVAEQLREHIQKGDFAPGAQLPTENALVEQFGVSRTVVREAISSLRVDGLVAAHQGRGVFVCDDISQQPFRLYSQNLDEKDHIEQAMELRSAWKYPMPSLQQYGAQTATSKRCMLLWKNNGLHMRRASLGKLKISNST